MASKPSTISKVYNPVRAVARTNNTKAIATIQNAYGASAGIGINVDNIPSPPTITAIHQVTTFGLLSFM